MEQKIKDIHNSPIYCVISEAGAGVGLAHALLSIDGASKTIYKTFCNYSKDSQIVYDHSGRAVSIDAVEAQLNYIDEISPEEVNTYIATSFQIKPDGCTHGWVGIHSKALGRYYYHLTLPAKINRKSCIKIITEELVEILMCYADTPNHYFCPKYVDGIFNHDKTFSDDTFNLDLIDFVCFDKAGDWQRFETLYRDKPINFYMGSFNPVHEGHIRIAYESENPAFVLSTTNFEKPRIARPEIRKRVDLLRGHQVIITKSGLFSVQIKYLKTRHNDITVSMGYDTLLRCQTSLFRMNPDVTFKIFDRNYEFDTGKHNNVHPTLPENVFFCTTPDDLQGISSTKIRNQQK